MTNIARDTKIYIDPSEYGDDLYSNMASLYEELEVIKLRLDDGDIETAKERLREAIADLRNDLWGLQ